MLDNSRFLTILLSTLLSTLALNLSPVFTPVYAYDGPNDVVEGWTYHVCKLKEAGLSKAPLRACVGADCKVIDEVADGAKLFAFPIDTEAQYWEAIPVDKFYVFWDFTTDPLPIGYIDKRFMCDTAVPVR